MLNGLQEKSRNFKVQQGSESLTLMRLRGRCFALLYWASTPTPASKSNCPTLFLMCYLTAGRVKQKLYKMKKSLFTAFAVGLGLTASLFAQVPSYVPTNGLVGWWPFNGNANDESGNLNNGTVNGATLTTDRFGNADKAYSFSSNNNTSISTNIGVVNGSFSIIGWYKASTPTSKYPRIFYLGDDPFNMTNNNFNMISAGIMGNEPSWIGVYTGRFYYESNIINNPLCI